MDKMKSFNHQVSVLIMSSILRTVLIIVLDKEPDCKDYIIDKICNSL